MDVGLPGSKVSVNPSGGTSVYKPARCLVGLVVEVIPESDVSCDIDYRRVHGQCPLAPRPVTTVSYGTVSVQAQAVVGYHLQVSSEDLSQVRQLRDVGCPLGCGLTRDVPGRAVVSEYETVLLHGLTDHLSC